MEVKELNIDPLIREPKRQITCDCGCSMFKVVAYKRFPTVPYLECVMCEAAYKAEEEVSELATSGDF